ncbi:MAG: ATP-dependent zinc metalloprotease FtsH [Turneriella sp.]|nr:ATP-dependent zinc metalloprotease FtsH [Turneriella sp.]
MASPNVQLSEIRAEVERVAEEVNVDKQKITISFERSEFNLRTEVPEVTDSLLIDVLAIAKRHIENWRLHTFEKSFLSVQALNENLFSSEGILERIKIRVSGLYGEKALEITKKGALTQAELSLIGALLKRALGRPKATDAIEELVQMGCYVYRPEDKMPEIAAFSRLKEKLRETLILPLKNPEVYDRIAQQTRAEFAVNRPRAVLFTGPPGMGKTTMARHVGKEAALIVVHVPLENLLSAYYGESTKRLAGIFDAAMAYHKPLILFLDEIDALAPSRNEKLFEASRRLLSVLLRKIDGLETQSNIITVGATNRPQDLDSALLSRFDSILEFNEPTEEDIRELLRFFAKQLPEEDNRTLAKKFITLSVRAIRDVCLRAERELAREQIEKKAGVPQAPTLEYYTRTLAEYRLTR